MISICSIRALMRSVHHVTSSVQLLPCSLFVSRCNNNFKDKSLIPDFMISKEILHLWDLFALLTNNGGQEGWVLTFRFRSKDLDKHEIYTGVKKQWTNDVNP